MNRANRTSNGSDTSASALAASSRTATPVALSSAPGAGAVAPPVGVPERALGRGVVVGRDDVAAAEVAAALEDADDVVRRVVHDRACRTLLARVAGDGEALCVHGRAGGQDRRELPREIPLRLGQALGALHVPGAQRAARVLAQPLDVGHERVRRNRGHDVVDEAADRPRVPRLGGPHVRRRLVVEPAVGRDRLRQRIRHEAGGPQVLDGPGGRAHERSAPRFAPQHRAVAPEIGGRAGRVADVQERRVVEAHHVLARVPGATKVLAQARVSGHEGLVVPDMPDDGARGQGGVERTPAVESDAVEDVRGRIRRRETTRSAASARRAAMAGTSPSSVVLVLPTGAGGHAAGPIVWRARRDLNPRHPEPESGALSN